MCSGIFGSILTLWFVGALRASRRESVRMNHQKRCSSVTVVPAVYFHLCDCNGLRGVLRTLNGKPIQHKVALSVEDLNDTTKKIAQNCTQKQGVICYNLYLSINGTCDKIVRDYFVTSAVFAAVQILIFPQKKGMVTNMVTRVLVEKRKGFDVEARHMMADLRQNLGLKGLAEDLRILNRYDVSGLSGEEFEAAARTILSEPNVDNVYDEKLQDQQRISRLRNGSFCPVTTSVRFRFPVRTALDAGRAPAGRLCKSDRGQGATFPKEEMDKIKNTSMNPVESRMASMEKPETLDMKIDVPADVKRVTA